MGKDAVAKRYKVNDDGVFTTWDVVDGENFVTMDNDTIDPTMISLRSTIPPYPTISVPYATVHKKPVWAWEEYAETLDRKAVKLHDKRARITQRVIDLDKKFEDVRKIINKLRRYEDPTNKGSSI